MKYQHHKIAEWVSPICNRYEDWLIAQGRIEEAWRLRETVKELDKQYFYDWDVAPFEARVACKRNWIEAFIVLVQGLGYPNLLSTKYANDL